MRLLRIPEPFDHPEFVYEPKIDGFRGLAHVRGHCCELVSRNGHVHSPAWTRQHERDKETAENRLGDGPQTFAATRGQRFADACSSERSRSRPSSPLRSRKA